MKEIDSLREMYLSIDNKRQLKEKELSALTKCTKKISDALLELEKEMEEIQGEGGNGKTLEILSAKEKQVFLLMVEGLDSHEIAERLGIRIKTVQSHNDRIKKKLEYDSIYELKMFAKTYGITHKKP